MGWRWSSSKITALGFKPSLFGASALYLGLAVLTATIARAFFPARGNRGRADAAGTQTDVTRAPLWSRHGAALAGHAARDPLALQRHLHVVAVVIQVDPVRILHTQLDPHAQLHAFEGN